MTTMTDIDRINTADLITEQLNANGISAKTYAPMTDGVAGTVRVYVDCYGHKWGHIVVGKDGRIDVDGLKRQAYEGVTKTVTGMGLIAYRGAGR